VSDPREDRRSLRRRLVNEMIDRRGSWESTPRDRLAERLRGLVDRRLEQLAPRTLDEQQLVEQVLDTILGLGPLEPLLRDPDVREIRVEGPRSVVVVRSGGREVGVEDDFDDAAHLERVIREILDGSRAGGTLQTTGPQTFQGALVDGSRFDAGLAPLRLRIEHAPMNPHPHE
jgi:pilus assembly protein CpaF